jgi:hypothetical protein
MRHPSQVLFAGEQPFPMMPAVDHYAGSEKLMYKALQLQNQLGPIFDVTCDCEDGAAAGADREHAEMVAAVIMSDANRHGRVGVRIHDLSHPHWQQDIEIIVGPCRATPGVRHPAESARERRCPKAAAASWRAQPPQQGSNARFPHTS